MATMKARRACSQSWKWTLTKASISQAAKPRNQIHAVLPVIRIMGVNHAPERSYGRGTGAVPRHCSTL